MVNLIMARYVVHVSTPKSVAEAFAYMADLRNFATWDPGVERVDQVTGNGAGLSTAFDVRLKSIGRSVTLRYNTTEYDAPNKVVAVAKNKLLTSFDTITVRADGDGSVVTYDAELTFNGILGLGDPFLALTFKVIGDRAAAGLVQALQGKKVTK